MMLYLISVLLLSCTEGFSNFASHRRDNEVRIKLLHLLKNAFRNHEPINNGRHNVKWIDGDDDFAKNAICGQRQASSAWTYLELMKRQATPVIESRIVNGRPADRAEFPWVVYLTLKDDDKEYVCGGSLIATNWVLTAAHCFDDLSSGDFLIRIGEHDLQSDVEEHQDINVTTVVIHPYYDNVTARNDIALLKLAEPADVNLPHISTICLTRKGFRVGTKCIVAGWGLTEDGGSRTSNVLQRADVEIKPPSNCSAFQPLDRTQLCAGGYVETEYFTVADSCEGDSGGPLFCPRNGIYYQAGIVSYGGRCGDPTNAGVYTKVARYIGWISYITGTEFV